MNKTKKNNNRNNKTKKNKTPPVFVLKNGLGNKLFLLVNILDKYKNDKVIFVERRSKHQYVDPENLIDIFPNIKKTMNPTFITWREYNKLKQKGINEGIYDNNIYDNNKGFFNQKKFLKTYLKMDSKYDYLLKKYDFENGIFVHVRYGDKFTTNYNTLKIMNEKDNEYKDKLWYFDILKPEYYIDSIKSLRKNNSPVYIFTDSVKMTKCLFEKEIEDLTFVNENTVETFFCFKHCKNLILSISTLGTSALYLNDNKNINVIAPDFSGLTIYENNKIIVESEKHIYPSFVILKDDKSYLLNKLEDYEKIIKDCDIEIKID